MSVVERLVVPDLRQSGISTDLSADHNPARCRNGSGTRTGRLRGVQSPAAKERVLPDQSCRIRDGAFELLCRGRMFHITQCLGQFPPRLRRPAGRAGQAAARWFAAMI